MAMENSSSLARYFHDVGFNGKEPFYLQEIPAIMHLAAQNPNFGLLDAVYKHLELRHLEPFDKEKLFRIEHDIAHLLVGIDFQLQKEAGHLPNDEYIDFQSAMYAEALAVPVETRIKPPEQPFPDMTEITPEIVEAVENEENLLRTAEWLIGGNIGEKQANIRYCSTENFTSDNNHPIVEGLSKLGYKVQYHRENYDNPLSRFTWTIFNQNNEEVYSSRGTGANPAHMKLPTSQHNGIEFFQPFTFLSPQACDALNQRMQAPVNFINSRIEKYGRRQTFEKMRFTDIVGVMRQQVRAPEAEFTLEDHA